MFHWQTNFLKDIPVGESFFQNHKTEVQNLKINEEKLLVAKQGLEDDSVHLKEELERKDKVSAHVIPVCY